MFRKTLYLWPVVCALGVAACSSAPESPLSPSATAPVSAALNPDGSSLKVTAPGNLQPNGSTIDSIRPTLTFNRATGVFEAFTAGSVGYEIEGQNAAGDVIYRGFIAPGGDASHALASDLVHATTYWWRVRARLGDEVGPWSGFAQFRTPDPPAPAAPAVAAGLPFPIPPPCAAGDGQGCVLAMLGVSPWWPACAAGSGTNCHRYTRSVAAALAASDPNWGLITKNPGEQQCSWNACGPGDGSGYGEDVLAYHTGNGNWVGWDIVVGAGGPGAGPNWAQLTSRRPGNNWAPVPPFP